jgi:pimeloyl-ACP methyl ester carboxylesterase
VAERLQSLAAGGHRLEAAWHGPPPDEAPTLVLLHEGLGCVAGWRDFPGALAAATGLGVLTYSRLGYGGSDPVPLPRPLTYMHAEGLTVLPEVLAAAGVRTALLVGHSDGASIALVWAGGTTGGPRRAGLVLLAPHVFCEDRSIAGIAAARVAYLHGDLRARLARFHGDNVDGAFWGWNGAWLDPGFRAWNLEAFLPAITLPGLVIQGDADPYGTLAQVDAIERGVRGRFDRLVLSGCGHAPHRERAAETRGAIVDFVRAQGLCRTAGPA